MIAVTIRPYKKGHIRVLEEPFKAKSYTPYADETTG
jgi:hypothetical protein